MSAGVGCLELRKGVRMCDKINWERRKKPEEEKPESSPGRWLSLEIKETAKDTGLKEPEREKNEKTE